jgi:hypothetical protein
MHVYGYWSNRRKLVEVRMEWQTVPNAARVHNDLLGGKDNYECDRDLADLIRKAFPTASRAAYACRAFGL